jgi:hypothetical protein
MANHMVQMLIYDYFVELIFLRLVTLDDNIPHMSEDHGLWASDDGNHVMVSNPSEMISTTAPRVSGHVVKP